MTRFLLSRVFWLVTMALLATLVVFLISTIVPGDPVLAQLGDVAASNPTIVAAWRHKYGFDLPLWEQFFIFLGNLLHGNLGVSIVSQRPVLEDITEYAPATLELATRRVPAGSDHRHSARHRRRSETRQLCRSFGALRLAARCLRPDLLARLHHAGDLLRPARYRTRPPAGSTPSHSHPTASPVSS